MQFKDTACCAMQEISGLKDYMTPKDAMMSFCRLSFNSQGKAAPRYWSFTGDDLYSFYIFSAAVYMKEAPSSTYANPTSERFRPYGQEFADFILENKLGTIISTPKIVNQAFHKDHGNQIWIWVVDQEAVKGWWRRHMGDEFKAPEKVKDDSGCQRLEDINYDNL